MRWLDKWAFWVGYILEKVLGPIFLGHIELWSIDPCANPTFNSLPSGKKKLLPGVEAHGPVCAQHPDDRAEDPVGITDCRAPSIGDKKGRVSDRFRLR
jgi:hypothetical protein